MLEHILVQQFFDNIQLALFIFFYSNSIFITNQDGAILRFDMYTSIYMYHYIADIIHNAYLVLEQRYMKRDYAVTRKSLISSGLFT